MTVQPLGRLSRVDLRDIWTSEASDFTPWLARPENIAVLSEALDIDLEVEAQERPVGPFRADILCKDTGTDQWVLIENQLERTDHTHLGQLLTYASGLDAVTIVWIAANFTEEHRSTLDWLNKITNEGFRLLRPRSRTLADRGLASRAEVQHRVEAEQLVAVSRAGSQGD